MKRIVFAAVAVLCAIACTQKVDVLVVGGGASGTAAGVQAARMGARTMIVEETPWLGGMLTSAGVSAIDGNYRLRGGIFREFTDAVAEHYGGYDSLKTGWVSHIQFEPRVGEAILEDMAAAERKLQVVKGLVFVHAHKLDHGWDVCFDDPDGERVTIRCKVLIDGTELGDVAKACGVAYHIGFDPRSYTGEEMALEEGNDIVQDMTMVMTIKDYGPDADMTIPRPEGYDQSMFVNCCKNPLNDASISKGQPLWSPEMMLSYGLLPGGEMMINWPVEANDFYANIIDMTREQRDSVIAVAKQRTLGFLYFLQTGLGMKNLGLAPEYPSEDGLALFPYYRESRRIEGEHLFTLDEARERYSTNAYRTGIAVGDYPVDHHHHAHPSWESLPKMIFAPIPSFTLSLGSLIPLKVEDLVVAEKSISVTNLINGSTRLQPVVVEIGQAAGVLAALAVKRRCPVRSVDVRSVQKELLAAGAYLQPWLDLKPGEEGFEAIQRVSSTGILRGEGRNVGWSNESWLHTSDPLRWNELDLGEYYDCCVVDSSDPVTLGEFYELLAGLGAKIPDDVIPSEAKESSISRLDAAILIDKYLDPFSRPVDFNGNLL
ncbi:MAG: FAD-dependent oxidoreductase [Bacteroidales bacterium]|nr:FAD-dependent oxidoreductase [Bacteroidales bacterium]